ncbi:oxidoreductase [Amycolatopsis sp. K13G38]|uniref:Oxidoreductase n=1 Tax=Amycolatopsis acididurans TaxID=2724524 RepID=A0ABX1JB50_9PSEU|nr:PDR/VanB family oxidoreductase [Amycolatopsis acididurans]NKQ56988.1 oxidoreductase [Amycolatopsis acididurans]
MTEPFKVQVASIVDAARDIRMFRLVRPSGAALPFAAPGSHIDVWTPGGPVRQYSLCEPGTLDGYTIAVKLERPSRGGSAAMHRVRERDMLEIGPPRDAFPLAGDARGHVLIAGGIGITPILAMARHLAASAAAFELHHFVRSVDHAAFHDVLTGPGLGAHSRVHAGLDPASTAAALADLIGDHARRDGAHLYCCGPAPLMQAARDTALALGWPPDSLHEERFTAAPAFPSGDNGFRVVLASSGREVEVGAGDSVLDALGRAGIDVDSSCEQGICGTCVTGVLDGEVDHRDQYLTDEEKAAGETMCLCVSRCRGTHLTLDL